MIGRVTHCVLVGLIGLVIMTKIEMHLESWRFFDEYYTSSLMSHSMSANHLLRQSVVMVIMLAELATSIS